MGSLSNPKPWVPYLNTNDCSQGFCSLYCPQWCYIIFPPPPPLEFPAAGKNSGPSFSPFVIAIIGILASAFLLVSYYAIISKYCGSSRRSRGRDQNRDPNEELGENNEDPSNHEPWHVANSGLDEALVRSIAVCKYKRGDGLVEGTECSVCLSEFQEDESLRLLPKCSHAFHVTCIDTWLKSHSNCPLCRANIVFVSPSPVMETVSNVESLNEIDGNDVVREDIETVVGVEEEKEEEEEEEVSRGNGVLPKTQQARVLSDLGDLEARDAIIEIADEDDPPIRRSVSMDYLCENRVLSIADVLRLKQDEIFQAEECQGDVGSWKQPAAAIEMSKCSSTRTRMLHCVMSPVAMKRSFSSGRFFFSRCGRGRNIIIPF